MECWGPPGGSRSAVRRLQSWPGLSSSARRVPRLVLARPHHSTRELRLLLFSHLVGGGMGEAKAMWGTETQRRCRRSTVWFLQEAALIHTPCQGLKVAMASSLGGVVERDRRGRALVPTERAREGVPRVALLTNAPAPYRIEFTNELARRCSILVVFD